MKSAGQAAMEYLLSYGWAVLIALVIGVSLWQTGFLKLGASSIAASGFTTTKPFLGSSIVNESGYSFDVLFTNGAGTKITLTEVKAINEFGHDSGPFEYCTVWGRSEKHQDWSCLHGGVAQCNPYPINGILTVERGEIFELKGWDFCGRLNTYDVVSIDVTIDYEITLNGQTSSHTSTGKIWRTQ